ncbi:MAG TPA: alpha/beta hydrolase [Actinomycetes bacterium]|nr:alpha/beta hydrolase [Actinomycetes bacterium]
MSPIDIRSNTVLPARRESLAIHTDDGLSLVGELALPIGKDPVATLITLHPLPTAGGFMDSHVIRKAALRLPALASVAVLRFNTRGTSSPAGLSGGSFDEGNAERFDLSAAVDLAVDRGLPSRWLWGWSFGTELVLRYGLRSDIEGAFLLSPPLRSASDEDLHAWGESGKPVTILVPEFDDYLRPDAAKERFALIPQAKLVPLAGAKHLCVGEQYVSRVLNEIVATVAPEYAPLRTMWDGPTGDLEVES